MRTPSRRGPGDARERAEAAFRAATTKPAPAPPAARRAPVIPGAKETVSLAIDREVLERFQADGPGWRERINAALRQAVGLRDGPPDEGLRPDQLNAENDG